MQLLTIATVIIFKMSYLKVNWWYLWKWYDQDLIPDVFFFIHILLELIVKILKQWLQIHLTKILICNITHKNKQFTP